MTLKFSHYHAFCGNEYISSRSNVKISPSPKPKRSHWEPSQSWAASLETFTLEAFPFSWVCVGLPCEEAPERPAGSGQCF